MHQAHMSKTIDHKSVREFRVVLPYNKTMTDHVHLEALMV